MRFTDLPVDRPVATVMLLVGLMVLGVVSISRIPLDFWPETDEPEIDIEVPYPGSHPLEGLKEVARPIEEEIATIPDVKRIFSNVNSGSVRLEAQFDWGVNIDLKKMEVREAVERARPRLPSEVDYIRVEGDISTGPGGGAIIEGRISAPRDLSESWELLDRRIRRPLERIKGVASVDLYGVEAQQVRIDIDLQALKKHGIEAGEVMEAIDAANLDLDLGAVRGDVLRYDVRSASRFRDIPAIRDLLLGESGLRVRDVARVELREPLLNYGRHLEREFAIGIDVYKEPTANTVETVDNLVARIDEIREDPALEGITLQLWLNQGEEIRNAIFGLRNAGVFGGLLAVVVLFFFLRRLRTTLVVAVAIPFSLVVTCAVMYLLGADLNVLSMLGLILGVGMMVDNAVVVIENIHRLEGQGLAARDAARRGAGEVALAVTAATATTLIVWSWLLVEKWGDLVSQVGAVALPICIAVVCSLLISLTFIPLAASRFAPRKDVKPGLLLSKMVPGYRAVLNWTFRHRFLTLTSLLLLAGTAVMPIINVEKVGEPKVLERDIAVQYEIHDPSSKDVIEGHVDRVEEWLEGMRDELGYESIYSFYRETPYATTRIFFPRTMVTESFLNDVENRLRPELPVIAGVTLSVGEDMRRHRGMRARGRRMINVALHGEDPEFLEKIGLRVEEHLDGMDDVVEVWGPSLVGTKEVRITIDPEKTHALGLTPRDVAQVVTFAFRGQRLRRFEGAGDEVDMVLGLPEEAQPGLATLLDLPLPRGGDLDSVPLSAVADFRIERTPQHIRRVDRITTSWVAVQFDDEAVPTTVEARERVSAAMAGFELPDGYAWSFGEYGRDRDDALGVMLRGVLLSLLLVVLLMAALFESMLQPLAIVITLPLAFFGAFWGLWIFGFVLDPVSFFGVILLIGIVVNNGIVMVNHVNTLRSQGMERVQALIQGCGDRLRPILMTAITTIFGLVPLAMSNFAIVGAPMASVATVIVGGLATSTIFTLIGLPVWYTMVEDLGAVVARMAPRWTGARRLSADRGVMLGD
jgi:HAE1 family hydrophobic/amphiphilic exporter-1